MQFKPSTELKQQFSYFIEQYPPQQFSAMLRRVLLAYMADRLKTGLPLHFGPFLRAMDDLFQILDTAATEMNCLPDS